MSEFVKTSVELPRSTHARVKALAKESGVSIGQYTLAAITRAAARGERVMLTFPETGRLVASERSENPEIED